MNFSENVSKRLQKALTIQLKEYQESLDEVTEEEKAALYKWVSEGHSPYVNGNELMTSCGTPLDFVSAYRFMRGEGIIKQDDGSQYDTCSIYRVEGNTFE